MSDTTRAVVLDNYGGPEVLEVREFPTAEPGPGQIRIAVAGAAVNPVDGYVRGGAMAQVTDAVRPLGLGWDVAGTIEAIGADVTGFAVGDRVAALHDALDDSIGGYTSHIVLGADAVAHAPDGVDLVELATLPLNVLTADQALDHLDLPSGSTVLVTGAAGALGGYAVRLGSRRGLRVIGLARAHDEAFVRGEGAAEFVTELDQVRELVPEGVDGVLDAALFGQPAMAPARDGGRFVAVGAPAKPAAERGVTVTLMGVHHDGARLAELLQGVPEGWLRPRLAGTVPLTDAGAAQQRTAAGGLRGRIVLVP